MSLHFQSLEEYVEQRMPQPNERCGHRLRRWRDSGTIFRVIIVACIIMTILGYSMCCHYNLPPGDLNSVWGVFYDCGVAGFVTLTILEMTRSYFHTRTLNMMIQNRLHQIHQN